MSAKEELLRRTVNGLLHEVDTLRRDVEALRQDKAELQKRIDSANKTLTDPNVICVEKWEADFWRDG